MRTSLPAWSSGAPTRRRPRRYWASRVATTTPSTASTGSASTTCRGRGVSPLEDFPVVPFAGSVTVSPFTDPALYQPTFSHKDETASPGYYAVTLSDGVKVELTVTKRTGIGKFTFPEGVTPSILVDPEVGEGGFSSGEVSVNSDDAFTGSDVSGDFCSLPGNYSVHFAANFETAFRTEGTWEAGALSTGKGRAAGTAPGVYATFPESAHGPTTITMKVGLSYTSVANASGNLRVEQHGWNFEGVREAAAKTWNRALSRISVKGGTAAQRQVFTRPSTTRSCSPRSSRTRTVNIPVSTAACTSPTGTRSTRTSRVGTSTEVRSRSSRCSRPRPRAVWSLPSSVTRVRTEAPSRAGNW